LDAGATTKNKRKKKHMMLAEMTGNVHIGLAFAGASIGDGIATVGVLLALARNPGMSGRILLWFFVGIGLIEAWAIIGWLVVSHTGL
jgi:F0F1-type ATP synthase membrane subunit c/vacuolar-type H+-ATPase subunit K